MVWDEDAALIIRSIQAFNFAFDLFEVIYTAYHVRDTGEFAMCQSVDTCFSTGSSNSLLDQYSYDCSNVYCGPNAIRSCGGLTQTVPCSPNLVSTPEIPSSQFVGCQKVRRGLSDEFNEVCGPCTENVAEEEGSDATVFYQYSCNTPPCSKCYSDGTCAIDGFLALSFFSTANVIDECVLWNNHGDSECYRIVLGPKEVSTSGVSFSFAECFFDLNNQTCSCDICGFDETSGVPLLRSDCSEASATENTVFDQCTGQYSGAFQFKSKELSNTVSCPTESVEPIPTLEPSSNITIGEEMVTGEEDTMFPFPNATSSEIDEICNGTVLFNISGSCDIDEMVNNANSAATAFNGNGKSYDVSLSNATLNCTEVTGETSVAVALNVTLSLIQGDCSDLTCKTQVTFGMEYSCSASKTGASTTNEGESVVRYLQNRALEPIEESKVLLLSTEIGEQYFLLLQADQGELIAPIELFNLVEFTEVNQSLTSEPSAAPSPSPLVSPPTQTPTPMPSAEDEATNAPSSQNTEPLTTTNPPTTLAPTSASDSSSASICLATSALSLAATICLL